MKVTGVVSSLPTQIGTSDGTYTRRDGPGYTTEHESSTPGVETKQGKGDCREGDSVTTLERHVVALAALGREVDEVKVKIEAKKLGEGASIEEVGEWSSGIDEKIEGVDIEVEYLRKCPSEARQHS